MLPSMLGLLRAEWLKAIKNYKLTGFLVWIYPVSLVAFFVIAPFTGLDFEPGQWTKDIPGIWTTIISFPYNLMLRMLPLAFMVNMFASEYQLGTWKNLVPRNRRTFLILAKCVVLVVIVMISLILSSLVIGAGQGVGHALSGTAYGPHLTGKVLADFLGVYAREAFLGMLSLSMLVGFAAVAVFLTRSVLGGLLVAFGLSIFESLSLHILLLLGGLLDKPGIINLYRFNPTYNLDNLRSWLVNNAPFQPAMPIFTATPSLAFSAIMLGVWVIGLMILVVYMFKQQDIAS
jgi:hypothetical protein